MKLTFLGAAREVTGSSYLLEHNDLKILIDCGLWQGSRLSGERNYQPFPFDPAKVDLVILTHAHLDHSGRLPYLYQQGFRGKIICTPPTRELVELIWQDTLGIMQSESEETGQLPLYGLEDVEQVRELFDPLDYDKVLPARDACLAGRQGSALGGDENGVKIKLIDAGHILGSAMAEIFWENKKIVFTGDFGNDPVPILRSPTAVREADYVVIESTYANRVHEDFQSREFLLRDIVEGIIKEKGVLMIPAFSLERTQELLYILNSLVENKNIPALPVFLDSPLAIKATEVYYKYPQYFDEEAAFLRETGDDFFKFPGLIKTPSAEESKKINTFKPPFIVIAGSGMLHGGRIRYHLRDRLGNRHNKLLIIGYQVEGTLGRKLLDGASEVRMFGETIPIRAKVQALGVFSAHADGNALYDWVSAIKGLKKVFVTHGEEASALAFVGRITTDLKTASTAPQTGESFEL